MRVGCSQALQGRDLGFSSKILLLQLRIERHRILGRLLFGGEGPDLGRFLLDDRYQLGALGSLGAISLGEKAGNNFVRGAGGFLQPRATASEATMMA